MNKKTKKFKEQEQSGSAPTPKFDAGSRSRRGFTLMEILVATTIFAVVSSALMSLFNLTLQINRRAEALRQATQGMRSFMEFLVKEIRNGQVNYLVINGNQPSPLSPIGPCAAPTFIPPGGPPYTSVGPTYVLRENKLGIISPEGIEECFYFGDENGSYALPNHFVESRGTLVLERSDGINRILNPTNFRVENLMFVIRPLKDPYTYTGGLVEIQPTVSIIGKFVAELPTGEEYPIFYQTSVSTNKYDVPRE